MTTQDITDCAVELLVKASDRVLRGQDLVDWATNALALGYDSPALVALAGADLDSVPIVADTLPLFFRAATELGLAVPVSDEEVFRAKARIIARRIVSGNVSPADGVAMMEKEVVLSLLPASPRDVCRSQ